MGNDSLLDSLSVLLKIAVVWVYAFFMQFRFYWHQMTREVLTGDYYAPCGFTIMPERLAKTIKHARLISVIEPMNYLVIPSYSESIEFVDVNICCLVTRRNRFQSKEV